MAYCFNRYMVECEFRIIIIIINCLMRFNRYMVECEYEATYRYHLMSSGFNRYMVECEFIQPPFQNLLCKF